MNAVRGDWSYLTEATAPCLDGRQKVDKRLKRTYTETRYGQCTSQPLHVWELSISFGDQETAKRFARAALHASLLCGGTKAVSPF